MSTRPARGIFPCLILAFALVGGCGDPTVHTVDAAAAEAGFCGTPANPGILTLENRTPTFGTTQNNLNILHGFTVTNAPAEFSHFDLRFGPTHTAGRPNPDNPKFKLVTVGSDVVYQLTILSWSQSPGHVELVASAGYATAAGCTWEFPAPLFSYDIVGGPDGGAPPDLATQGDGSLPADVAIDVAVPNADAALDGGSLPIEAAAPLDGGAPDAPENPDVALPAVGLDGGNGADSNLDS